MQASNRTRHWTPAQNTDQNPYSTDISQGSHFSEPHNHSSSFVSFSPNSSTVSQQGSRYTYTPYVTKPGFTDNVDDLQYRLRELEAALLGTDQDFTESYHVSSVTNSGTADLKELLIACAKAVAENDLVTAEWLISELRPMVSVSGEPVRRLGAYVLEGLVARLSFSGSSIYNSLRCKEPTGGQLFSYMRLLYEACPYFKFGYLSANGAIAEAMKNENRIHIVDFQIAQGGQWLTLIQALAARPGGPPSVRITGVDDSTNAYARGGGLDVVSRMLVDLAETFNVPFEFHGVSVSGSEVEAEHIDVRPGEALAVNFAFMLHHMPDESVDPRNHRDRLLRLVKSLSPRIVTLVEQESNVNTAPFLHRFHETLDYYTSMFESIDATLPRDHKDRINVEQHCLARDIVNIIACEGAERVERHELLGKWKSRFAMAGFTACSLSTYVNATVKTLLESYCDKYRLEERDGALFLGWMNRDLVASCAWK